MGMNRAAHKFTFIQNFVSPRKYAGSFQSQATESVVLRKRLLPQGILRCRPLLLSPPNILGRRTTPPRATPPLQATNVSRPEPLPARCKNGQITHQSLRPNSFWPLPSVSNASKSSAPWYATNESRGCAGAISLV